MQTGQDRNDPRIAQRIEDRLALAPGRDQPFQPQPGQLLADRRLTQADQPFQLAHRFLAFGEMAQELLLSSQNVQPKALEESGFKHDHPELEDALRHLLARPVRQRPVPVGGSA